MTDGVYRNTCPRNCYGTCGILSHVKNGKLIKVTGDPKHGYTKGKLCAKGYASTQFVYDAKRLKYPMMQNPRGSGKWKRLSWEEAYTIIATKMIELNQRYGSNLAAGYNKFSGNLGILHYAVEGMFNSFGPHTKPIGNPCAQTGKLANIYSIGHNLTFIPESMVNSKLIVIWGANPAITNVHQMKFIYEARRKGAKLVVIDPIFTKTGQKADLYIQINPGTDASLALGLTKMIIDGKNYDEQSIKEQSDEWEQYKSYIQSTVNLTDVCKYTGVSIEAISILAELYGTMKPAATWNGLGIQRNSNGNESIGAINSLVAITGNLTIPSGGLYYMHFDVDDFPMTLLNHLGPEHPTLPSSREIDINNYAENALSFTEPPLKFMWIASRNIMTQDQDIRGWEELFKQMELIVTVDLFLTKTAMQSDIVLPASSHFEEEDLNVGYWHHWLSINQKAIDPYYESKSDLRIARELTKKLNELSPSFSNFPSEKEPLDWIKDELTPEIMQRYSMDSIEDLLLESRRKQEVPANSAGLDKFKLFPDTGLYILDSDDHSTNEMHPDSPAYRLLSPQSLLKIHSQYEELTWLTPDEDEDRIEISKDIAERHQIKENSKIEVYNEHGLIIGFAKINTLLPKNVITAKQGGNNPINQLIGLRSAPKLDMNESSTFFYDSMVDIRKWREENV
ncbi:MAG: molybdopterin-dependent oxidoreductase [Bacillus sp. (in: Bacteria)]|nr:molybdopterin-dependent oxidoreductase [Bacillus sp. (in: firmicutes)]